MGIEPNWQDLPKLQADLQSAFDEIGGQHFTAICISAEGVYHIHDVVSYKTAKRRDTVSKEYGNCHVEEMRGKKEEAKAYITKAGKFAEKGEKVLCTFGNIDAIKDNSGKRTDLANFDALCLQEDFNLNSFLLNSCTNERDEKYLERRYARVLAECNKGWRNINVIYVEGEAGDGKSRNAFERYPKNFKTNVAEKTSFPFNGYHGEKVLWLDELRPGIFSHGELMQILDGYPLNVDVKYGQFPACWTTILITTAFKFTEWYKDDNREGNENRRAQFRRRIKERYIAKDGKWIEVNKDEKGNWIEPSEFIPIPSNSEIPFT